jgi:hypothetical protein
LKQLNQHFARCLINFQQIGNNNRNPNVISERHSNHPSSVNKTIATTTNNYNNFNNDNVTDKNKHPFDKRFIELRNNLEIKKVDWRDAHCKMEITREGTLKQSMTKINKIDLFKVIKTN